MQVSQSGRREAGTPQGRLLGGSGALNGLLFLSTSEASVESWKRLGNDRWGWTAFQNAQKRSYTLHKSSGETEGSGPLQLNVTDPDSNWLLKAWTESLDNLGFPPSDPLGGQTCGSAIIPESIDPVNKQRSYSANAYLDLAKSPANLTIICEAACSKIIFNKETTGLAVAEGVQYSTSSDPEPKIIKARKQVIVSAGAINSPRLLELSGIGDSQRLQKLGIEVIVDNPHVGENLQTHALTGITFQAHDDTDTLDALQRGDPAAAAAAMAAYQQGTGPMATSNTNGSAQLPFPLIDTIEGKAELEKLLAGFKSSAAVPTTAAFAKAHEEFIHAQLSAPKHGQVLLLTAPAFVPFETDPSKAEGKYLSVVLMLSHPLSRGAVHITNSSPENASTNEGITIDERLLSDPFDVEVLTHHIRYIEQHIAHATPLSSLLKARVDRFDSLDAARDYVRATTSAARHYTGTCSMMPRELGGVVGDNLRVHGTANLSVCDASIIPIVPSVNSQAAVYGVAELGADIIKANL